MQSDKTRIISLLWTVSLLEIGCMGDNQCKDMLQGYLTGQLTTALGTLQVESLRKEMKATVDNFESDIKEQLIKMKKNIKLLNETKVSGQKEFASYVRWGKKTCPQDAELVYSGFAGGEWYLHPGGGANILCLPQDSEWGLYQDGVDQSRGYVYGTEYQFKSLSDSRNKLLDHDVPCAFCKVSGKTTIDMFPARRSCYNGWKKEYSGYLVSGYHSNKNGRTEYKCLDESPDTVDGGHASKDGNLFYPVEGRCGSLKCPPYVKGRELTCVVCSS